jgi:hypothetical protein
MPEPEEKEEAGTVEAPLSAAPPLHIVGSINPSIRHRARRHPDAIKIHFSTPRAHRAATSFSFLFFSFLFKSSHRRSSTCPDVGSTSDT